MKEYHKIINIYERDNVTNKLIEGKYKESTLEFLKECNWIATEKVDGTNIRIHWDGKDVMFGGRTDNAMIPTPLVQWLNNKFLTITSRQIFATKFGDKKITLYGEGYGGAIQKAGSTYGGTQRFVLFDIKVDDIWLERGNIVGIAEMFGLEVVPVVVSGKLDDIVNYIKGKPKSTWGDFETEGVVARPSVEITNRFGERVIVKIKCRDF